MELSTTVIFSYLVSVLLLGTLILIPAIRENINWKLTSSGLVVPALISCIVYYSYGAYVSTDTEYWGGYGKVAEYYEYWDEEVSCRHPVYCKGSCSTDSQGRTSCAPDYICGYSHAYDVDEHPPYWQLKDSTGTTFDVGQDTFEKLAKRWNSRKFIELNRRNVHSKDGDAYFAYFDNADEHLEFTTTAHSYINKVPVSDSLWRFRDISPEEALKEGVYGYPEIHNYHQATIIAPQSLGLSKPENEYYIQRINARLGGKKQVRCYLLVYLNKSAEISETQERYWQGGNKNELIITVGVDKDLNIQWARAFSWAFTLPPNGEVPKAEIKNYLGGQDKLNIPTFGNWLYDEINQKFVRRPFTPLNEQLDISYPFWLCILCITLSNTVTITLIIFPVADEIKEWYNNIRYGTINLKLFR